MSLLCAGAGCWVVGFFFFNYFCPGHVSFPIHRKLEHLDVNETLDREQKVLSSPFLNRKLGEIPTLVDANSYTLSMGSCKGFSKICRSHTTHSHFLPCA